MDGCMSELARHYFPVTVALHLLSPIPDLAAPLLYRRGG
jgi:hypothetical protein